MAATGAVEGWIPAFAGMTEKRPDFGERHSPLPAPPRKPVATT
jgi:hypothetical protein